MVLKRLVLLACFAVCVFAIGCNDDSKKENNGADSDKITSNDKDLLENDSEIIDEDKVVVDEDKIAEDEDKIITDDDKIAAVCGNGIIEEGEICDPEKKGELVDCETLGEEYGYGYVECKADCTVDISQCPKKTDEAKPYGKITINFSTDYIYDYSKIEKEGTTYLDSYPGIGTEPAFTGEIGYTEGARESLVPENGDAETLAAKATFNGKTNIFLLQDFWTETGITGYSVQAAMPLSAKTGDVLAVCPHKMPFFIFKKNPDNSIKCMAALILSDEKPVLNVDLAEGLDLSEGGKLKLSATDVTLWHPTATPDGIITAETAEQNYGFPPCPIIK